MNFSKTLAAALAGCLLCATPALAAPVTIDFEGAFYTDSTISGGNSTLPSITRFQDNSATPTVSGSITGVTGGANQAWLYDTDRDSGTTRDPDLEGPFYDAASRASYEANGNDTDKLTGAVSDFGMALIIQELGATVPDDEASGGTYKLVFDSAVTLHSLVLLDSSTNSNGVTFNLYDSNNLLINTNPISNLLNGDSNGGTFNSDPTGFLVEGDAKPNWYETFMFGDILGVKTLEVNLNNVSGAIDNIVVSLPPEVPQNFVPIPAAAWLFASALGLFGYLGKRKSKA